MANKISHKIQFLEGDWDLDTLEMVCVPHHKYREVTICLKGGGWNIPIAKLKLHSKDLFIT